MTAAELRLKSTEELEALGRELRENLFRLKMQHHTGQLDKSSRLKGARRDIARIETLLGERKQAQPHDGGR
ncbi:MAG: 50S ribosomal protein L29 [Bradymonadales bacterium]|nr:50S ribosomal protein L29 [Bradymonadales bacterium]